MISYREKEMMMVMKYLSDHMNDFAQGISASISEMTNHEKVTYEHEALPDFEDYEDLVRLAIDNGYDTTVRIEDLLSFEELKEIEEEYEKIENEFNKLTKLNETDRIFIVVAVALQMIRQVFQPKLEFEAFKTGDDRPGDKEAAKKAKNDVDDDKLDKKLNKAEGDETKGSRYYHASLAEICDFGYTPYDITNGSKKFGLGIGGKKHRIMTLGHDPRLGYFFGTCNILTNTLTCGKSNAFRSFIIERDLKNIPVISKNADFKKIYEHSIARLEESKATIAIALAHQTYHINSDKLSKEGISLPYLQALFTDETVLQEIIDNNIDFGRLEFLENVGKQFAIAELINYAIAVAHRISIAITENIGKEDGKILTKEEFVATLKTNKTLDEVRTKKVVLISSVIASAMNALVIGGVEIAAYFMENAELSAKAIKKIDIGGYLSTLVHLFSDGRFIIKMKKDFIANAAKVNFEEKMKAIDAGDL